MELTFENHVNAEGRVTDTKKLLSDVFDQMVLITPADKEKDPEMRTVRVEQGEDVTKRPFDPPSYLCHRTFPFCGMHSFSRLNFSLSQYMLCMGLNPSEFDMDTQGRKASEGGRQVGRNVFKVHSFPFVVMEAKSRPYMIAVEGH